MGGSQGAACVQCRHRASLPPSPLPDCCRPLSDAPPPLVILACRGRRRILATAAAGAAGAAAAYAVYKWWYAEDSPDEGQASGSGARRGADRGGAGGVLIDPQGAAGTSQQVRQQWKQTRMGEEWACIAQLAAAMGPCCTG